MNPSIQDLPDWAQTDVIAAYRKHWKSWAGWSAPPERMARALTQLEDECELSKAPRKQGVREQLRTLRRAFEARTDEGV